MPAVARQRPGEVRSDIASGKEQISTGWLVSGATGESDATAAVVAAAPSTMTGITGTLVLRQVQLDQRPGPNGAQYATLTYTLPDYGAKSTGETVFNFDTTGGTQHITHGKGTVARYPSGTNGAPDLNGFINVGESDIGGCDITVPNFGFTATLYYRSDLVTSTLINTFYNLTGKTNDANWYPVIDGVQLSFLEGEVLYLGATGSRRGIGDVEIGHHFAASQNANSLTIGSITGVSKRGWEYLWVKTNQQIVGSGSNQRVVCQGEYVYVEKVYDEASFDGHALPTWQSSTGGAGSAGDSSTGGFFGLISGGG